MDSNDSTLLVACGLVVGTLLGTLLGAFLLTCRVESEAIEKGLMHHNPQTGKKEWVNK